MREPDHRDPRVRNHAAAAIENAGGPKGQGRIGGSGFRDDDEEGQGEGDFQIRDFKVDSGELLSTLNLLPHDVGTVLARTAYHEVARGFAST